MEGTCMVYVSLLADNMGNKYYVHIYRAEQNKFLFDKISTIYSNKSIQHNSMDSLDPSLRLNRYITGTLVKMSWLHIIWQSVKNNKIVKSDNLTTSVASQIVKMTTHFAT